MEEILSSIRRIIADEETDEAGATDNEDQAASADAEASTMDALEVLEDDDEDEDDSSDILELTSVVEEEVEADAEPEPADDPVPSATLELVDDTVDEDDIEVAAIDGLTDVTDLADDDIEVDVEIDDADDDVVSDIEAALSRDEDVLEEVTIDTIETTTSQEDEPAVSTKKAETEALLSTGTASTTTGAFAKLSKAFRPTPVEESVADGAGRTVEQFIEDMARPMLKEWLDENMPAIVERLVQKEIQKIARRAELL